MKKLLLSILLLGTISLNAQYCLFLDIKAENPEMVVSALSTAMNTEWGKNIQGTKSLFAYAINGSTDSTHSLQICFPNEAAFEQAFMSYGQSLEAQLLLDGKLADFSVAVSQSLNTPIWYNGEELGGRQCFHAIPNGSNKPKLILKGI